MKRKHSKEIKNTVKKIYHQIENIYTKIGIIKKNKIKISELKCTNIKRKINRRGKTEDLIQ